MSKSIAPEISQLELNNEVDKIAKLFKMRWFIATVKEHPEIIEELTIIKSYLLSPSKLKIIDTQGDELQKLLKVFTEYELLTSSLENIYSKKIEVLTEV